MTWGFLWLMLALKIPIAALIYLVWWAIKQTPEQPESSDGGGGSKLRRTHPRKPFPQRPRRPRRGPHGDPPPPAPARMRTVHARARKIGHGGTGGHSSSS